MKSIFDEQARQELISRINMLTKNSTAQWGKMSVSQMLRHCRLCEEYYHGKFPVKRSLLGRFAGPATLKNILKDGSPFQKNAPTSPVFRVFDQALDFDVEKQQWISYLRIMRTTPKVILFTGSLEK